MSKNNYNLPFYISKIYNRYTQKINFKNVVLDIKSPTTHEEIHYKEIRDSYTYLINNVNSYIDSNLFIKAYFLLTNRRLSKHKAERLVILYYQYKDCDLVELLLFLLQEIKIIIVYKKLEFSLLIINYFFKKIFNSEIELNNSFLKKIRNLLKKKEDTIYLLLALKRSLINNENIKTNNISKRMILDFFEDNKKIIKEKFLIKRLFLFGSFADGSQNFESDLDLLVIFEENVKSKDNGLLSKKFSTFVEDKLNISTDVVQFSYAISSMDYLSINKIITIY